MLHPSQQQQQQRNPSQDAASQQPFQNITNTFNASHHQHQHHHHHRQQLKTGLPSQLPPGSKDRSDAIAQLRRMRFAIKHSDMYSDDFAFFCHVTVPKGMVPYIPPGVQLTEQQALELGIEFKPPGCWFHVTSFASEPTVLLFRAERDAFLEARQRCQQQQQQQQHPAPGSNCGNNNKYSSNGNNNSNNYSHNHSNSNSNHHGSAAPQSQGAPYRNNNTSSSGLTGSVADVDEHCWVVESRELEAREHVVLANSTTFNQGPAY